MLNPAIEDLILDYNIYSTIIEKFGTNRNQVFDTNYDVVLKHAEVEQAKRTKYDKTYKEVYRHLHNSGVMYDYMAQGCKYISYLIHKDVKNTLDLYYDEEIFKIFRKFVEDYYNRTRSSTSTCLPHIVYVNHDMYAKLDTIYGLYDLYMKVLSLNTPWNENKCLLFKFFMNQYNDYIKYKKPTSSKLKGILKHFDGYLRNTIKGLDGKCTNYTYPIENIEQYKPPDENKPPRTSELAPLPSQALQHPEENSGGRITNTKVTELTLPQSLPSAPELRSITTKSDMERVVEAELGSGRGPESVIEKVTVSEPQAQELHSYGTLRTHVGKGSMGQLEYRRTVESPEQLELTDDRSLYPQNGLEIDQGTVGKITGAITGVLREVEPGPILGVSGGMGALFLLFKLDPSLEEEEDEFIKFLVALEDFHRENSQFFKNMMLGIFDMVQ
ncbi:VIR protein [Plasmodium vivax]|uniref:VIR protein n=1 Tax=Plasmodium vivax TaxID=5855 RepID=A0A1G4E9S8_PLAVI|nr:VIR protein [Plasmodium vivax]